MRQGRPDHLRQVPVHTVAKLDKNQLSRSLEQHGGQKTDAEDGGFYAAEPGSGMRGVSRAIDVVRPRAACAVHDDGIVVCEPKI